MPELLPPILLIVPGRGQTIDEYPPEGGGPFVSCDAFIVPAEVKTAIIAEGHAPGVTWKPGICFRWIARGRRAGTGIERAEITGHALRVYEDVPAVPIQGKQVIGSGDPVSADHAEQRFCFTSFGVVDGLKKKYHGFLSYSETILSPDQSLSKASGVMDSQGLLGRN